MTKITYNDGMKIYWDHPIEMEDGVILRADIFCPEAAGKYPVIMTYGVYGKWLDFRDGYKPQWDIMVEKFPEVMHNTSSKYQNWEVVDPERWVPDGYVCVRIDSRGAGRSPGYLDPFSPRETKDFYNCIQWAAEQDWSNGKIGLNGISYYAINQWQVAELQPPNLTAMCIWEGAHDLYREWAYHGGIFCTYGGNWYKGRCIPRQHGLGVNGYKARINGDYVSGPPTLSNEELGFNRTNMNSDMFQNKLVTDQYWQERIPDFSKIHVPVLSAANWGGQSLHSRGNFEGFGKIASTEKWLEVHGLEHWTEFYTDYGVEIQKLFFGHFLKGKDNGWDKRPKVQLQVRHPGEKFVERFEQDWPLPSTNWSKFYLDFENMTLGNSNPSADQTVSYDPMGDGITLTTKPLAEEVEITGPMAAKLFVSSESTDADLFLVVRAFYPDFKEVVFKGALDPHTPIAQGWLRASHRKLDKALTRPDRPYHTHDEKQPLSPGEVYELDIEIWPSCITLPRI